MSAEPTIDVDELVRPIPGDAPGGVPLPLDAVGNLNNWRKEPDLDFGDGNAPAANWGKVIAATTDFLTRTGKDLTAAVRLVEAVTKKHAATGLRDGLTLLTRLAESGWEHVHPVCEPNDQEARLNRLNWLNDVEKGGQFPLTVIRMPVVKTTRGDGFSAADWLDPARRAEVEANATAVTADSLKRALGELTEARAALTRLGQVLDEKMGSESPNLSDDVPGGLGMSVLKCVDFVHGLAQVKGVTLEDGPAVGPGDGPPSNDGGGGKGGGPVAVSGGRDQLYRSLAQIADALKRIEPHSPIPYLLERCVKLGAMPFPDLMREVIRETGTLDELDRLLGIHREG